MKGFFMRALREKMKEAAKRDNRGLSLVEILCAVAIFSLIVAGVSTIIVLSSKTFRRGVTETNLQQEAQLVANRIGTIVQDACEASFDSGTLTLKTSDADGNVKTYEIIHQDGELRYKEEGTPFYAKLAGKIEEFTVATDDFDKSNTVYLDMKLADDNKVYKVQYAIAARNEMTADFPAMGPGDYLGLLCDSEVVMVPGETYTIPVDIVSSTSSVVNILAIPDGSGYFERLVATPGSTAGSVDIKLKDNIPTSVHDIKFTVETEERKPGTSEPRSFAQVIVHVRQVKRVEVTHDIDNSGVEESKRGSSYEAQGCVHKFTANVQATYAEKRVGAPYENGYEDPKAVNWTVTATGLPAGKTYRDYFEDPVYGTNDSGAPTVECKIKNDLPSGVRLTALAESAHAQRKNKGQVNYYHGGPADGYNAPNVTEDELKKPSEQWGYNSFAARPAKINPPDEISLDPTETGSVKLLMKGGKLTDIECIPRGNTDSSTQAYFNPSDNCVYVKIGKDERGSGTTPSDPKKKFTFAVDVCDKNTGDTKATITVHVKRVDKIILDKVDNKDGSYTFTTRFNVDRGASLEEVKNLEEVENNSLYLINNKYNPRNPDGSLQNRTPFTLGVVYTFQVQDDGKKIDLGYIISRATCATEPNADKNIWNATFDPKNDYITWEDYPYPASHSAAVTGEDTDDSHLTELPTLKIKKGSKSFEKITITAIAFHALGAEKGKDYLSAAEGIFLGRASYGVIKDEQVIIGDSTKIKVPEMVIVEPGQGTNDPAQSDYEMAIPIEVGDASVHKMTATISGNSSSDTGLSAYEKEDANGNKNPYFGQGGGSDGNSIWYLGLVIGKDEKGRDGSGLFDLTVTAYDAEGTEITTFESKIAVRRVNEIRLEVKDENKKETDIAKLNKQGGIVWLEAYPTGFDGTSYFDIQKDKDNNICRWEKANHGEYKSPLPIKWTMKIGSTEKPFEEWTEYFESWIPREQDQEKYIDKISFKLKKPLPNGTIIRATSLHALGKVDSTKYNKAGKEYDKVVAEIKIGNSYARAPFSRGEEYFFTGESVTDIIEYSNKINQEKNVQTEARFYFRFYDYKTGVWSPYYATQEKGNPQKFCSVESQVFLPDREYDIDIIKVVSDPDNKVLYWPKDLAGTAGTGFESYTEATYAELDQYMAGQTYPKCYHMGVATPVFNGSYNLGSQTAPIKVTNGNTYEAKITDVIDMNMDKTGVQMKNYLIPMTVQKYENGKWNSIDVSVIKQQNNIYSWDIPQYDNANFRISVRNSNSSGLYRIGVGVKAEVFKQASGALKDVKYSSITSPSEFALYNASLDTGFIYLQIN